MQYRIVKEEIKMDFDFNEWARDTIASIDFWLFDITKAIFSFFRNLGF